MAQKDYVGRDRSAVKKHKTGPHKTRKGRKNTSGVSPLMLVVALCLLAGFGGGLYYLKISNSAKSTILTQTRTNEPQLPPVPETRYSYPDKLKNPHLVLPTPQVNTELSLANNNMLNDEQREVLAQIQADMRQDERVLSSSYNRQVSASQAVERLPTTTPVEYNASKNKAPVKPEPKLKATQPIFKSQEVQAASVESSQQSRAKIQPISIETQAKPIKVETKPVEVQAQPITADNRQAKPVRPIFKSMDPSDSSGSAQAKPVEAQTKPATPVEKPTVSGSWRLQCGSFRAPEQAEAVKASLSLAGLPTRIERGGWWYRVIVGSYASREAANAVVPQAVRAGAADCIVVAPRG